MLALAPVAAALAYPYWLSVFHAAVSQPDRPVLRYGLTGLCLIAALAVPAIGIWVAVRMGRISPQARLHIRAKRVAFLSVAAPPLFVLFGVGLGLLGARVADTTLWLGVWLLAGVYVALGSSEPYPASSRSLPAVRMAHGIIALFVVCFVGFHLFNHLLGWLGPDVHAAVMEWGRQVYRAPVVEPLLIGLLLIQIASGGALVWRWSVSATDGYRVFQVAAGDYLAVFILAHLNSALISARTVHDIETDWSWASGAPEGLLLDAWNIRLLPHYAFGVFFILAHLASGLRQVLMAHGLAANRANRLWAAGLLVSAGVSTVIMFALCGARI